MGFSKKIIILLFLIGHVNCFAQKGIIFLESDLERAVTLAQQSDKLIFVDTYAPWCQPCKRMNTEFRDKDLARYFNKNFVNLKVNMDSEIGKKIDLQYEVVFLPTFLILDKFGNIKVKVDQMVNAQELLNLGRQINEGDGYITTAKVSNSNNNDQTSLKNDGANNDNKSQIQVKPKSKKGSPDPSQTEVQVEVSEVMKKEEKILYVLGDVGHASPEMLKQEAYFRMKLMDGSHIASAKKYLETQAKWDSPENIKFIYDFLYNTGTKEFNYLLENRNLFEKLIGKEKITKTIKILVHNKLQQGFPRPNLEDAILLYSYVDPKQAVNHAHAYYIERLFNENKIKEFRVLAKNYLEDINPQNDAILYKLARSYSDEELLDPFILNQSIRYLEKAVSLNSNVYDYFFVLADLNIRNGNKERAYSAAVKALNLANKKGIEEASIKTLIRRIEKL